jgi:hypothetical protein
MPNGTQSRIFVPILPCSLDEAIYSVDVDLPAELEAELRSYAQRDGNSWTAQAERALILYHEKFLREPDEKAKSIAWAIQQLKELVPPRPPKKLSARQKESYLARKNAAIAGLRTEGFAGNLVLERDLFEFVRRAVEDGTFSSASEMVIAALPLLRTKLLSRP